jgi:antitoxin ParD1/3/4
MPKTTSLILGEHFERFVKRKVATGEYASASEVIREALRELQRDDAKEQALLAELDHALASGRAKPGVFGRLRKKHGIRSPRRSA